MLVETGRPPPTASLAAEMDVHGLPPFAMRRWLLRKDAHRKVPCVTYRHIQVEVHNHHYN